MKLLDSQKGIYRPDFFGSGVLTAFSGREFPKDKFPEFMQGLEISNINLVKQVHGNELRVIRGLTPIGPGDGLLTNQVSMALGILTADCLPLYMWDSGARVAGIVHAGWKGMKAGIIENAIGKLRSKFSTRVENLRIAFGPAIRKCCYEVGPEFQEYFPVSYLAPQQGQSKGRMDLINEAAFRLGRRGVDLAEIQDVEICTSCSRSRFFSTRSGDADQRILSVIMIRK